MRILRWIGIVLGLLVVGLVGLGVAARFSDGPIAIFAGGPLEAGELVTDAEPDWSAFADVATLELQLQDPPRSRTTWFVVHEGRLFVPCGYMDSAWGRVWKKWPLEAERDGRGLVRLGGRRYPRSVERVRDPELFATVASLVAEKYDVPADRASVDRGGLWIFELGPPGPGARPEA